MVTQFMRLCAATVLVVVMTTSVFAAGPPAIDVLLEKHCVTVSSMGNFRVSLLGRIRLPDSGDFQDMHSVEWIHTPLTDRFVAQTFGLYGPDGEYVQLEKDRGMYRQESFDQLEWRVLENFNPDAPPDLPVQPGGRHGIDYMKIKGQITPRDPARGAIDLCHFWLLLSVDGLESVETTLRKQSPDDLTISGTAEQPVVEFSADVGITRLTFSQEAGYLVEKFEVIDPTGKLLTQIQVTDFQQAQQGPAFPLAVETTRNGRKCLLVSVKSAEFGTEVPAAEQIVQFPEGIRVDSAADQVVHIWGRNNQPEHSFADFEVFRKWEDQMARANDPAASYASIGGTPADVANTARRFPLWVNGVILAGIVCLLIVRRRFA